MNQKMSVLYGIIIAVSVVMDPTSHAAPIPELMAIVDHELTGLEAGVRGYSEVDAISELNSDVSDTSLTQSELNLESPKNDSKYTSYSDPNESWYLKSFWIRIRGKAGFSLASFAKVELIPEMEMFWTRPFPEGWNAYKPQP